MRLGYMSMFILLPPLFHQLKNHGFVKTNFFGLHFFFCFFIKRFIATNSNAYIYTKILIIRKLGLKIPINFTTFTQILHDCYPNRLLFNFTSNRIPSLSIFSLITATRRRLSYQYRCLKVGGILV